MKRRSWPAVVVNLVVPGLGQVYNGQALKGVLFYALVLVAWAVALLILIYVPIAPLNVLLAAVLFGGFYLYVLWDAGVTARRTPDLPVRPYNRWYVYVAAILVSVFIVQPLAIRAMKDRWAEAFSIPGDSMAPTLVRGDYLIVTKTGRRRAPPRRFSMAVFVPPGLPEGVLAKRIVGIPGDTLEMKGKLLYVDGTQADEPYVQHDDPDDVFSPAMDWERQYLAAPADTVGYRPTRDNWGPLVVPPGHYFVLGDNRDESEDSRYFGLVPAGNLIGVPRRIYFSHAAGGGIRWARIGREVR